MDTFPTADTPDDLLDIINASEYAADDVSLEMCERLIALAAERTQSRGESAFEQEKDYVFTSDWQNMVQEKLGSHGDRANEFALGVINPDISSGKDAYLVEEGIVPQWRWLESGDGRMNDVIEVDLTDTDYHDNAGEMWWPKDYTLVVELADSLVKTTPSAADAM